MYNVHYHIFVRKSYLFACVINEEVPNPYQCPGEYNRLFCPASITSSWYVNKYDRRGSIQQIDAAEMNNVNTKRKTESDIRIFKDGLSTVGEPCNPKDIGVEEMNMLLQDFFSVRTKSKQDYELIQWNVSKLPSVDILVMANVIHAIVPPIENYENRTVTPISFRYDSVQTTVTNNNSVHQTVINLAPMMPNSRIFLMIKYPGKSDNRIFGINDQNWNSGVYWKVMLHFVNSLINMGNHNADFYTLFIFCCYFDK